MAANIDLLELHMKKAHNVPLGPASQSDKTYKCENCPKSYSRRESLRRHIREVHEGQGQVQGQVHKCDKCDKKYYRKEGLRRHVRIVHEGAQAGQCYMCDNKYFRDLDRHIVVTHSLKSQGQVQGQSHNVCQQILAPNTCHNVVTNVVTVLKMSNL